MEELQKAPVAFSHSSTEETRSTAVQGLSEVIAGAQQPIIMTRIKNGDFVRHVFSVTEVVQMATAVIFLSCMMVKCTRPVPPRIQLSRGVPPRTTMMWINSGAIVEVTRPAQFPSPKLPTHHVLLIVMVNAWTRVPTTAV